MTDEQAIERIAQALAKGQNDALWLADDDERASCVDDWRSEALIAWNEIKAIEREGMVTAEAASSVTFERIEPVIVTGLRYPT